MKTALLAFATLTLAAPAAHAEIFRCTFTEPFIGVTYDTSTQVMEIEDGVLEKTQKLRHVSFQVEGAGKFVMKDRKGQELLRLELSGAGSDGMSDTIYPYEGTGQRFGGSFPNGGVGGCSSSLLPTKELEEGAR